MPTTTKMGIVYPSSTDLVKDGATAMGTISTTVDAKTGLVLLSTASFSAVSSFSLPNNTFSSSYNDYLLEINFTGSSATPDVTMRMRASGSDTSSTVYDRGALTSVMNTSSVSTLNAVSQSSWLLGAINPTYPTYTQMQILFKSPNTTNAFKVIFVQSVYVNSGGNGQIILLNGAVSSATQFDSASIIASTGNFTGNYSVYGYNKA